MDNKSKITVEVAYATPEEQILLEIQVPVGTTAIQATSLSKIEEQVEALDLTSAKLGIFGKAKPADTVLEEFDRVEIYRPLIADPKEVRKRIAEEKKQAEAAAAAKV